MTDKLADVTSTKPSHWKYISEGGATIVFSYVGPSNPFFDGMVLRLRKVANEVNSTEDGPSSELKDEPDDPSISFQHTCMERLIPPTHLPRLESVRVSRSWLESFSDIHDSERPVERREHDGIDLSKKKGVIATNLVGGEGIAVEIKPKWSFLPNTTFLSSSTHPVKSRTCRFCMHSSMKSSADKQVPSGYCPLDLFSGDSTRIKNAIHSLYDAWLLSKGTLNNLKIFVRGNKISIEDRSSMLEDQHSVAQDDIREVFTDAILPFLTNTPTLRILNKLQRTLDILDVEGLSQLWKRSHSSTNDIGVDAPEPDLAEWTSFIDTYISNEVDLSPTVPQPEHLRHYLLAYLLSATFKDCSIMVQMDLLRPSTQPLLGVDPSRVTVIDLDPKSMDRLKKWQKLDSKIVETYAHVPEADRRNCVDGWAP